MIEARRALTFIAFTIALAPATARAAAMDDLQYLVGSWTCTATAGSTTIVEEQNVVAIPGWIYGTGSVTINGQPSGQDSFYVGYDVSNARWVLVSIGSAGTYSIATSRSPNFNGSRWIGGYPPGSANSTFTENSPTRYTITHTLTSKGHTTTVADVCSKGK